MPDHIPVLLEEVIRFIEPRSNQDFVDATLGGGGYTLGLLKKNGPRGIVISFDLDPEAISHAQKRLHSYKDRVIYINDNFDKIKTKINEYKFNKISGVVCDLGYSSLQVEDQTRGFSFDSEGKLDLRFSPQTALTADEILHHWSEKRLADILKNFGEEPLSRSIARQIVYFRKKSKITAKLLKKIVTDLYARRWSKYSRVHPSTRTWQALRIAVNNEFENLKKFLPAAVEIMPKGAKLAIVSFHSGEDKIIKNFFKISARDCICPKEAAVCICQHQASLKILTTKPIKPSANEVEKNYRSRSAKLRVVEKI